MLVYISAWWIHSFPRNLDGFSLFESEYSFRILLLKPVLTKCYYFYLFLLLFEQEVINLIWYNISLFTYRLTRLSIFEALKLWEFKKEKKRNINSNGKKSGWCYLYVGSNTEESTLNHKRRVHGRDISTLPDSFTVAKQWLSALPWWGNN